MKLFRSSAVFFALLFLFCTLLCGDSAASPSISNYRVVSETRVSRTLFKYVITADLVNDETAKSAIRADVRSISPHTTIIKWSLGFPPVDAGSTIASFDSIEITHDRRFPFDLAQLQWDFAIVEEETLASIGTAGGTMALGDGSQLRIPSGALSETVQITMRREILQDSEGRSDMIYHFEPSGLVFSSPATLILPVSPAAVFEEVAVLTRQTPQNAWVFAQAVTQTREDEDGHHFEDPFPINSENNTIEAAISHFSDVKVVDLTTKLEPLDLDKKVLAIIQREKKTGKIHNQWPFKKEKLGPLDVYRFLFTEDHKKDVIICGQVGQTFPKFQGNSITRYDKIQEREPTKVTHIILHDFGINADAHQVLRQVLLLANPDNPLPINKDTGKTEPIPGYAHFWIATDGTIFQTVELNGMARHTNPDSKNNDMTVGIEMAPDPKNKNGGFTEKTMHSVAILSDYLIRELHLPFDPEIEKLSRMAQKKNRFIPLAVPPAKYAKLPNAARHVIFIGHDEIQENRDDPRLFNWEGFIDRVAAISFPPIPPNPINFFGPLVDCSEQNLGSGNDMHGGAVHFESKNFVANSGSIPATKDFFVIAKGIGELKGGEYNKVYIGENAIVNWNISDGDILKCGSFYLGRGAILRLNSESRASATISSERILQIDGLIDASGRDDVASIGTRTAVNLTLETGAGEFFRVPSIISRGANSADINVPGGMGGEVKIINSYSGSKLMIFGNNDASQTAAFKPSYVQRSKSDYFAYGGNSFTVLEGRSNAAGIITSGGAGCGGPAPLTPGGNGGNGGDISINGGTSAKIRFSEVTDFVSGAGADNVDESPIEVLSMKYQNLGLGYNLPSGGNGGRGKFSFGNARGGNGGNGGRAGDITINGVLENEFSVTHYVGVHLLSGGGGRNPLQIERYIYVVSDALGEAVRVSAIGGSGGPRGGDSITGNPGIDGKKGTDGEISFPGLSIQRPD